MLGQQGWLLFGEPCERDLGFTASSRGALNLPQALSIFRPNRAAELNSVGSEHAPQSANRDPEIMQRLGIEAIFQPPVSSDGRVQTFERETTCRFLFAPSQEVVGQRGLAFGFSLAIGRRQLRDLRNRLILPAS